MSATRTLLLDAAEHVARLEKALADAERREADWRTEAKAYQAALVKWEPDACKSFGCTHLVPTAAQLAQFRALGATWDEVQAFAWMQGWCSVSCSERDNVLPFVRPEEAAP